MTAFPKLDPEAGVLTTYTEAAQAGTGLCCPAQYDPRLLAAIPK